MPNKDIHKSQPVEPKALTSIAGHHGSASKLTTTTAKICSGKDKCVKDATMSPGAPTPAAADAERTELLGSLTTQQQQRTSARVIKKLRLEPPAERDKRPAKKDGADEIPECETPNKIEDKDLKFPTVKQRMPKALWSTDEKNLFFEALNEYGKDFDAITAYICGKMKKKGMPDVNLKTKTQVSHFYYRTWHKLSKHVHFDENVKKVAQELYALINYGELRKKLVSVNEKTCARLGEMVARGSMAVRARGRNVRVRTPMCRALRRLNQLAERACGARLCARGLAVAVALRARDAGAWARVQGAAHNPRAAAALPLRTRLAALLRALAHRWRARSTYKPSKIPENAIDNSKCPEDVQKDVEDVEFTVKQTCPEEREEDRELEDHLNLEPERITVQEQKGSKKLALHLGPRPGVDIHLPVVSPSEQLSSQKICFSSYLERMGKCKDSSAKIRTPKRQRKDSTTDKDKESDQKKFKMDDTEKLFNIEETAIDGIELMANYKTHADDEEKPSTEDEKEREIVEEDGDRDMLEREKETDREKDMSEKEKDSFSEMEDDEKYNKSDTDNESDHGKEKSEKDTKFKNLKVKFRIRPKKRGGSIYTLVTENPEEPKSDEPKIEEAKFEEPTKEEDPKPDIDVDMAIKQIRKGWSISDAGELTIGDLYLMFGARSKLELDYWWAEPTPPLPQPQNSTTTLQPDKGLLIADKKEKPDKTPDKGADSSVEDDKERRESDSDMMSPKNTFSQDSNDGLSGDERKSEQLLASPEHKSSSASCNSTLKLVSKLINRPQAPAQNNGFAMMSDRLKRLLALAGNPHVSAGAGGAAGGGAGGASGAGAGGAARCSCGHVCAQQRRQRQQPYPPQYGGAGAVFRHPTPIAPRPDAEVPRSEANILEGVPRWRRGRPRGATDRRVVVQRLLPLLPKLPPPSNLIPVKCLVQPNSPPVPPRILPKPPPTSTSDLSFFYVLSESNGQFFFHDGDRRIPITALPTNSAGEINADEIKEEGISDGVKSEASCTSSQNCKEFPKQEPRDEPSIEPATSDVKINDSSADFLPSESMSLSPSRLLRDAEGWLGSVQDFSLSSFLGHLEGRSQPELAVDSHLHSLMAESSVDYVAKFADLAAEVSGDVHAPAPDDVT